MHDLSRETSTVGLMAIVTTNAEGSAEAEVADIGHVRAKGRMICNVNQQCMCRRHRLIRYGSET